MGQIQTLPQCLKRLTSTGRVQTRKKNKKAVQKFESREEYFIKNGGILLEKQLALGYGRDVAERLKVLSQTEIKNATNNFDPNLIFGSIVRKANMYKGTLGDRLVFIITPQERDLNPELADLFLTEVSVSLVLHHGNMIEVYGCCLETYIPMIVYHQYVRSKSLREYLHGEVVLQKAMKWRDHLKIATDVAYALSYMHNALSKPIVHRDVESYIILIDSSFHAMLTSLAHSVSITPGKKNKIWPVHGTPGYIDPEYIKSQEVTDKCDVYSFGVLMLELLTTKDPVEMARIGKDLVTEFVSEVETNGIKEVINRNVLEEGNLSEIQKFAKLALKCVAKKGNERPTMISVVEELWRIQVQDDNRCGRNA